MSSCSLVSGTCCAGDPAKCADVNDPVKCPFIKSCFDSTNSVYGAACSKNDLDTCHTPELWACPANSTTCEGCEDTPGFRVKSQGRNSCISDEFKISPKFQSMCPYTVNTGLFTKGNTDAASILGKCQQFCNNMNTRAVCLTSEDKSVDNMDQFVYGCVLKPGDTQRTDVNSLPDASAACLSVGTHVNLSQADVAGLNQTLSVATSVQATQNVVNAATALSNACAALKTGDDCKQNGSCSWNSSKSICYSTCADLKDASACSTPNCNWNATTNSCRSCSQLSGSDAKTQCTSPCLRADSNTCYAKCSDLSQSDCAAPGNGSCKWNPKQNACIDTKSINCASYSGAGNVEMCKSFAECKTGMNYSCSPASDLGIGPSIGIALAVIIVLMMLFFGFSWAYHNTTLSN